MPGFWSINGEKLCEVGPSPAHTTLFLRVPATSYSPRSGLCHEMPSTLSAMQVTWLLPSSLSVSPKVLR
jgi:hypothetical protein